MTKGLTTALVLGGMIVAACGPAWAETVMQQCGRQYQDAKAANTLNGMTWNQYRSDCATRMKAQPGTAAVTPAAAAAPAAQAANPLNPPPAVPATAPAAVPAAPEASAPPAASVPAKPAATGGRAAFLTRQKECGAEWRANKTTLVAQTPGLTWPKYLSQCNKRLKAAGQ